MKNGKLEIGGTEWNIFSELIRIGKIYSVFNYIYHNGKCIVNDILLTLKMNKRTLYKYINKGCGMGLIGKKSESEDNKNGAHYSVVAKPRLKPFLKEIRKIIADFWQDQ